MKKERTKCPFSMVRKRSIAYSKTAFEAWEDKEKTRESTSVDKVNDLPTDEEHWAGWKEQTDANGNQVMAALTRADELLCNNNAESKA